MGDFYTVSFTAVAITAVSDLFELKPGSTRPIRLHAIDLVQTSDQATSESETLRCTISRHGSGYTSGSGGTGTAAVVPVQSGGRAALFTAETNNTTQASGGTPVVLQEFGWQVLSPGLWAPPVPPDQKPTALSGEALVVKMNAPVDSITVSGTAWVEEL